MQPWKYIDQILSVLRDEPPGPPVPPLDDDSEVVMPVPMAHRKVEPPEDDDGIVDEPGDMG